MILHGLWELFRIHLGCPERMTFSENGGSGSSTGFLKGDKRIKAHIYVCVARACLQFKMLFGDCLICIPTKFSVGPCIHLKYLTRIHIWRCVPVWHLILRIHYLFLNCKTELSEPESYVHLQISQLNRLASHPFNQRTWQNSPSLLAPAL